MKRGDSFFFLSFFLLLRMSFSWKDVYVYIRIIYFQMEENKNGCLYGKKYMEKFLFEFPFNEHCLGQLIQKRLE